MKKDDIQEEIFEREEVTPEAEAADEAISEPKALIVLSKKKAIIIAVVILLLVAAAALAVFLPGGLLSTPLTRGGTVITVGELEIPADEYIYTLGQIMGQNGQNDPAYYENDPELEATILKQVEEGLIEQYIFLSWIKDDGITLTEEDTAALDLILQQTKDSFASEEEYQTALGESYLTEELLLRLYNQQYLMQKMSESLYANEEFSGVSEAEYTEYMDRNGAYCFKQIIITGDTEEGATEKQELAAMIAAELNADPTRFMELSELYNEDERPESVEYGYDCLVGQLDAEVENQITSVQIGQTTGAIEIEGNYYIFLRSEPHGVTYQTSIFAEKVQAKVDEYKAKLPVKYAYGFNRIALSQLG